MAVTEGIGNVAPSLVDIKIDASAIACLKEIAVERDRHRGYGSSSLQWKRGSCSNPILVGLVGEYAVEQYLKRAGLRCSIVDSSLNEGDNGIDFVFAGVTYQVKTSEGIYGTCLVRRICERHSIRPLASDRFVFCKWRIRDDYCSIRGWCDKQTVLRSKLEKSKRGDWWNNAVESKQLDRISNLALLAAMEVSNGE